MTKRIEVAGTALIAAVLLAFVHHLMQPSPLSALSGVAGGLCAFWLGRRRRLAAAGIGWIVGAFVGVLFHLYAHVSEGRTEEPSEGLVAHLATAGAQGALIAAIVLVLSVVAFQAAARR